MRAELKNELESAGLLGYRPGAVYLKAALLLLISVAFFAAFMLVPSWWLKVPLFLCGVSVNIGLVMMGHESGHGAISRRPFVNDLLGYVTFPLLSGLSHNYWRYKHNTLHHAYVNVDGKDPDIRIYPMAMNKHQRAQRFGLAWIVQRIQGFIFWPLTLFTVFAMRYDGAKFTVKAGRKAGNARERVIDRACLVGHLVGWFVVPVVFFHASLLAVVLFYTAWSALAGLLLGAVFIPAHMTKPIYSSYSDNFALQVETTQNLLTNRIFSALLIGLDHQVEHHLFPRMSHLNVRKAAPIVRAYCKRNNLPYFEQGWGAALWASTLRLHHDLPHYDPGAQPQPAAIGVI